MSNLENSNVAELIFETTFSIEESITGTAAQTVATINTGFTSAEYENDFICIAVIQCINDTDADMSYIHFKERMQMITSAGSTGNVDAGYCNAQSTSGYAFFKDTSEVINGVYGSEYGLYVSTCGKYLTSITLTAKNHDSSWGHVVSGDYAFKLYRLNKEFFGIEGV